MRLNLSVDYTTPPYSFIHLPPTLYNVFLPVLQVSLVSIIPPLLHTHSFNYHPRGIIFLSKYFRFPLSLSIQNCSIFIHLPPTLYNVFLPVLQFSPVSIIPPLLHTHSSIYHPHCIMVFSQYFSFPCQYHSTIAPLPSIHPSTCFSYGRTNGRILRTVKYCSFV